MVPSLKAIALQAVENGIRARCNNVMFTRRPSNPHRWASFLPSYNPAFHRRVRHSNPAMMHALGMLEDQGVYLTKVSRPKLENYLSRCLKTKGVVVVRTKPSAKLKVPDKAAYHVSVRDKVYVPKKAAAVMAWLEANGMKACLTASQSRKCGIPRRIRA